MALVKGYKGSINASEGHVLEYARWHNNIKPVKKVALSNKEASKKEANFSAKKFIANKKARAFKKYLDSTNMEDKYESKVIKLIGMDNYRFILHASGARRYRYTEESACSLIQIYKTLELFNLI